MQSQPLGSASLPRKYNPGWIFYLFSSLLAIFIGWAAGLISSVLLPLINPYFVAVITVIIAIGIARMIAYKIYILFDTDGLHIRSKAVIPYSNIRSLTMKNIGAGRWSNYVIAINDTIFISNRIYSYAATQEMAGLLKNLAPQAQTDENFEIKVKYLYGIKKDS